MLKLREVEDGDQLPEGAGLVQPPDQRGLIRWMVLAPALTDKRVEAMRLHMLEWHLWEECHALNLPRWIREAYEATQ